MQSPTISQLRETVRRVLEGEETVRLAYVFGSAAKGTLSRASDVDVAVGFREPEAALERLRLLGLLEDRLRIALGRPVDVVDLFRSPPILVHQILTSGRPPALVRDERQRLEFECRARKEYFDMKRRYAVYDREAAH